MLSSIPLIAPRDAHSLWYTPSSTFAPSLPATYTTHPAPSLPSSQNIHPSTLPHRQQQQQHQQHQQQQLLRHRAPAISPLTQLALDEQSLHQRKVNIQRFGATWIKPPGIHKTYQGELDDKAEREEAERQAMMEDDGQGEDEVFDDEDGEGVLTRDGDDEEVDLDAGIPEVDSLLSDDEEEGLSEEEDDEEEGAEGAEGEVDLDAGVPEASAVWEDSEEEEEDEEEEDDYDDDEEEDETQHTAGIDSSPHQAMYSHDEHFGPPDSRVEQRLRAYPRRSLVRSDDEMEVDSDN